MDYRKLKSGSDVRGVAVGENAVLTKDVVKTLGAAFARWTAQQVNKPVEEVSIALGRDSRVSGPSLLAAAAEGIVCTQKAPRAQSTRRKCTLHLQIGNTTKPTGGELICAY